MNMSFIPDDDYSRYQAYLKQKAEECEYGYPPPEKKHNWFSKNRNIILTSIFSAVILGVLGFIGTMCKTTIDEVKTLTVQQAVIENDIQYLKQSNQEINQKLDILISK